MEGKSYKRGKRIFAKSKVSRSVRAVTICDVAGKIDFDLENIYISDFLTKNSAFETKTKGAKNDILLRILRFPNVTNINRKRVIDFVISAVPYIALDRHKYVSK